MKKIFHVLIFLTIIIPSLRSQKVYYIYLQSENQQPFYARLGQKIYNSSDGGYLILSNLRDSAYEMNIGMQGSQAPDQPYSLIVNRKDQGYLIKDFGTKGWGLFNLISLSVVMPVNNTSFQQTVKTEKVEDNAFTNLLAKATDDSTIKERPVIVKTEEKKSEPVLVAGVKTDEQKVEIEKPKTEKIQTEVNPVENKELTKSATAAAAIQQSDTSTKNDIIVVAPVAESRIQDSLPKNNEVNSEKETLEDLPYTRSEVKLKSESSTTAGIGLVFLDTYRENTDTIKILIPATTNQSEIVKPKPEDKKFLEILPATSGENTAGNTNAVVKSNNCNLVANEDDFYKLRKKMAGEKNDDDMITEARKVFKTKCFTTQQVKNLSTLFLTDEFKYKFFDESYQYVSDLDSFSSLQSELKDEYYINRFKAMLH